MNTSVFINLAKHRRPPLMDFFLGWAVTVGRLLVIFTEIVALGSFLYRFGLDRQLSDLHDKITQETNVVKFLQSSENTYRNLQLRLSLANEIIKQQNSVSKSYQGLVSLIPSDMIIRNITFVPENVKLDISVPTISSLATFIKDLKEDPDVKAVSINSIENKTSASVLNAIVTVHFNTIQSNLL